MAIWLIILLVVLLLVIACIVGCRIVPTFWGGAGGASLLGEKVIGDADTARRFADEMFQEASDIWAQESGWHVALKSDELQVDSIRIDHGPFANSGVYLTRATAKLAKTSPEHVFSLMTSLDGFAIIDPISDPADFAIVNEPYSGWRGKGARLEVAPARAPMPGATPRKFCVLNAIDPEAQVFCSKSVQHKSMPGSSKYADGGAPSSGNVRALNTFALRTRSDGTDTMLDLINFADMCSGPTLLNWINVKAFFPGIVQRLKKRLAEDSAPTSGKQDPSQPLLNQAGA